MKKPGEPRAEVLGVRVPKLVAALLSDLRQETGDWSKSGHVDVPDETHAALKEFRDAVHAIGEAKARGNPHVLPDGKPRCAEALIWVLALNGSVITYGKPAAQKK